MPKVTLTQSYIDKGLQCPKGKTKIEYVNKDLAGHLIEVRATSQPFGTHYYRRTYGDGKQKYLKLGRTNEIKLATALKMIKDIKSEIAFGEDPKADEQKAKRVPTLSQFFNEVYLPHAKLHKRSWKNDKQLYDSQLEKAFGNLKLTQISKAHVMKLHRRLRKEGRSASTCDHYPKFLRRILNFAKDQNLIQRNQLDRFPLFREENFVERYLSDAEQAKLVDVLRTDSNRTVSNMLLFLLSTGARRSEAFHVKWADINLEAKALTVPAEISKSKRRHTIPLNGVAISVLDEMRSISNAEYVFANPKTGNPYKCIKKAWTRIRKLADLPDMRLHDLRHNFASLLVNSGHSLYVVQHILGHSDPKVTQRYAHLSTETLREAADAAGSLIR